MEGSKIIERYLDENERVISRFTRYILTNTRLIRFSYLKHGFESLSLSEMSINQMAGGIRILLALGTASIALIIPVFLVYLQGQESGTLFLANVLTNLFMAFVFFYIWRISTKNFYQLSSQKTRKKWKINTYGISTGIDFVNSILEQRKISANL